jgi:hypothetical protein
VAVGPHRRRHRHARAGPRGRHPGYIRNPRRCRRSRGRRLWQFIHSLGSTHHVGRHCRPNGGGQGSTGWKRRNRGERLFSRLLDRPAAGRGRSGCARRRVHRTRRRRCLVRGGRSPYLPTRDCRPAQRPSQHECRQPWHRRRLLQAGPRQPLVRVSGSVHDPVLPAIGCRLSLFRQEPIAKNRFPHRWPQSHYSEGPFPPLADSIGRNHTVLETVRQRKRLPVCRGRQDERTLGKLDNLDGSSSASGLPSASKARINREALQISRVGKARNDHVSARVRRTDSEQS